MSQFVGPETGRKIDGAGQPVPIIEYLETFPNPGGDNYLNQIDVEEFTSVCPKTGQPDYGQLQIQYVPDKLCLELKALKIYLQQYRNMGIFYEAVTNKIFDDLVQACQPKDMVVKTRWSSRGGISSTISRCLSSTISRSSQ